MKARRAWKIIFYTVLSIYSIYYVTSFTLFFITALPLPFTMNGINKAPVPVLAYIEVVVTLIAFVGFSGFVYSKYYFNADFWKFLFIIVVLASLNWVGLILQDWRFDELPVITFNMEDTMRHPEYISNRLSEDREIQVNKYYFLFEIFIKYLKIFATAFIIAALYTYSFKRTEWLNK